VPNISYRAAAPWSVRRNGFLRRLVGLDTWSFAELLMSRMTFPPCLPGHRGCGRIGGRFYANVSMSISLETLARIRPVGLGQFDSPRRWGALALLGRCPAGAVTSSPDVLVGGVVCWSCCCGGCPGQPFPMAPIVSAVPIAVVSPSVGSWVHAGMRWCRNSYQDSTLRVTTSHRRPPSVDLYSRPESGTKRGT
jgi:hypothetical protein